jgi:hypothetical protein
MYEGWQMDLSYLLYLPLLVKLEKRSGCCKKDLEEASGLAAFKRYGNLRFNA